jgi:nucleotide-binding universal stress UspA family protein
MFKHILVATDGTRFSLKAVKTAVELAAKLNARLSGVHVLPATAYDFVGDVVSTRLISPAEARQNEAKMAKTVFRSFDNMAKAARVRAQGVCLTSDDVHDTIIAAAKKQRCDLIVMASHGRRGLAGLLLGSETNKVVTHSKIPVLVCR